MTSNQPASTEHSFAAESAARSARRVFVQQGRAVSLLAFDPARDLYVFDVIA